MDERVFARGPVKPWNLKDRPAALGSKQIGLDLRWSRLAPLCCWPGLPSEFETDFANARGALCGISGRGFRSSSHVSFNVAKLENRIALKISRKLIFGLLCCCVVFQRQNGGP